MFTFFEISANGILAINSRIRWPILIKEVTKSAGIILEETDVQFQDIGLKTIDENQLKDR